MNRPAHRSWAAWLLGVCWLALLAGLMPRAQGQELQAVPPLQQRVTDLTGTLSAAQVGALDAKLAAFEAEAGPQLVVLIVATTAPEDIASYAYRVADQWKVGRREVGDGVLLLVAKNDRKVRIEVAKALEGAVPDLAARQIIDRAITPAFKAGDFAGGLNGAIDLLVARIKGEHLPAPQPRGERSSGRAAADGFGWDALAMFFFIGVPLAGALLTSLMGRKLGSLATGAGTGGIAWLISASPWLAGGAALLAVVLVGLLGIGSARQRGSGGTSRVRSGRAGGLAVPPIIWGGGGGGGSSWGGGGGGGGGFSSGGGGDFGGGGASGDW